MSKMFALDGEVVVRLGQESAIRPARGAFIDITHCASLWTRPVLPRENLDRMRRMAHSPRMRTDAAECGANVQMRSCRIVRGPGWQGRLDASSAFQTRERRARSPSTRMQASEIIETRGREPFGEWR